MIRCAVAFLLVTGGFLSACSGPIETRVATQWAAPLTKDMTYQFTEKPEQSNPIYSAAQAIVSEALDKKGLKNKPDGSILVQLSIAERPASISITSGGNDSVRDIAIQKEKKFLQSCDDVEHRLSISLIEKLGGTILYRGNAAEFHCKGTLEQSLRPLIEGALADLGDSQIPDSRETIKTRGGIE